MNERIHVSDPVPVTDILRSFGYDEKDLQILTRDQIIHLIREYYGG